MAGPRVAASTASASSRLWPRRPSPRIPRPRRSKRSASCRCAKTAFANCRCGTEESPSVASPKGLGTVLVPHGATVKPTRSHPDYTLICLERLETWEKQRNSTMAAICPTVPVTGLSIRWLRVRVPSPSLENKGLTENQKTVSRLGTELRYRIKHPHPFQRAGVRATRRLPWVHPHGSSRRVPMARIASPWF